MKIQILFHATRILAIRKKNQKQNQKVVSLLWPCCQVGPWKNKMSDNLFPSLLSLSCWQVNVKYHNWISIFYPLAVRVLVRINSYPHIYVLLLLVFPDFPPPLIPTMIQIFSCRLHDLKKGHDQVQTRKSCWTKLGSCTRKINLMITTSAKNGRSKIHTFMFFTIGSW